MKKALSRFGSELVLFRRGSSLRNTYGEIPALDGRYLPVCKNRWFFRLVCLENPREQIWHLNGHEPLCTYICDLRSPGVGNDFEQRLHLWGFSCNFKRKHGYKLLVPIPWAQCKQTYEISKKKERSRPKLWVQWYGISSHKRWPFVFHLYISIHIFILFFSRPSLSIWTQCHSIPPTWSIATHSVFNKIYLYPINIKRHLLYRLLYII